MTIPLLKLSDIALRSLFILVSLFSLEPRAAGQFGLLITLIAFLTFGVGYERYAVIQRRLAAASAADADRIVLSSLRLYGVNYLIVIPVFVLLAALWLELGAYDVLLAVLILVGEHFSIEIYRLAVVSHRYRGVLAATIVRSAVAMVSLVFALGTSASGLRLTLVLEIWSVTLVVGMLAVAVLHRRTRNVQAMPAWRSRAELFAQYRESFTHFAIGFVALCSVQADRAIVGTLTSFEDSGVYLKNAFLAASFYQATTILLNNRVLMNLYQHVAQSRYPEASALIALESRRAVAIYCLGIFGALLAGTTIQHLENGGLKGISPVFVAGLLGAFMFRSLADYNCTLLNAAGRERAILLAHGIAVVIAGVVNVACTSTFGISGAVVAMLTGSLVLLVLSGHFRRKNFMIRTVGR